MLIRGVTVELGTKAKTTPSGLPAAGWWRRGVATLIDDVLGFVVIWFAGLFAASIIGKVIWTAVTQTIIDVRTKLGDVVHGIATSDNVQQQIQDLVNAYRASGKTPNDLGELLINAYINNLHLTVTQGLLLAVCVIGCFYFAIYNHIIRIHRKGRSFGDGLVGIYTVTDAAFFPNYRAAIVRYLSMGLIAGTISAVGSFSSSVADVTNVLTATVLLVDLLFPLFDKHARSLHDLIAGTYPAHPDRFGYSLEHMTASVIE
jgi:uncharacterized RDD family membrane protein YckC